MRRVGSFLSLAIVAVFAAVGSAVPAHAGPLAMQLYENNVLVGTFLDNLPCDVDPTLGVIDIDVATCVNPFLTTFVFQSLRSTSNSSSSDPGALTHSGEFSELSLPDCPGGTITIIATDNNYNVLPTPPTLSNSTSIDFHNAPAGSSLTSRSWFNPTNVLFATDFPPGGLTTVVPLDASGHASATATTAVPDIIPYGLTNRSDIFIAPCEPGMPTPGVSVGVMTSAVPEPSALSMGLGALPLLAGVVWRARRRTAS